MLGLRLGLEPTGLGLGLGLSELDYITAIDLIQKDSRVKVISYLIMLLCRMK